MEEIVKLIIFYCLGAAIVFSSILAVTLRRMLRAATFLLIVLICTAGLYLLLNYHFLAVVQLAVYAGGILILFIFAILLTNSRGDRTEPHDRQRLVAGVVTAIAGVTVTVCVIIKHKFLYVDNPTILGNQEINMEKIGNALMGTGKYEYLLSFEALSVLLLVCAIGGILIARKR